MGFVMCQLFEMGFLKSFKHLFRESKVPWSYFFRYLQLRHALSSLLKRKMVLFAQNKLDYILKN